jgi:hypothetical protein
MQEHNRELERNLVRGDIVRPVTHLRCCRRESNTAYTHAYIIFS